MLPGFSPEKNTIQCETAMTEHVLSDIFPVPVSVINQTLKTVPFTILDTCLLTLGLFRFHCLSSSLDVHNTQS